MARRRFSNMLTVAEMRWNLALDLVERSEGSETATVMEDDVAAGASGRADPYGGRATPVMARATRHDDRLDGPAMPEPSRFDMARG
jgi:hypothetical protein